MKLRTPSKPPRPRSPPSACPAGAAVAAQAADGPLGSTRRKAGKDGLRRFGGAWRQLRGRELLWLDSRLPLGRSGSLSCSVGPLASGMLGSAWTPLLVTAASLSDLSDAALCPTGRAAVAVPPVAGRANRRQLATQDAEEDPVCFSQRLPSDRRSGGTNRLRLRCRTHVGCIGPAAVDVNDEQRADCALLAESCLAVY